MKNRIIAAAFTVAFVLALGWAVPGQAQAGVDVNISIPLFGVYSYERQPVIIAPSPYGYVPGAYAAPPAQAGAVLYGGYWYLPTGGRWYVAARSGGPWAVIAMEQVPYAVISGPVLMNAPSPYYSVPEGPSVGVSINPWIFINGHGGRDSGQGGRGEHGGHGRGHDD